MGRTDEAEIVTKELINDLEAEMLQAAEALEFEKAAAIRDQITNLQDSVGEPIAKVKGKASAPKKRGRKGRSQIPRPKKRG